MSSGSVANTGYILKITEETYAKLNLAHTPKFINYCAEKDKCLDYAAFLQFCEWLLLFTDVSEAINIHIINEIYHLHEEIQVIIFEYHADDGEPYDDLEDGKFYLRFYEDDLYYKELSNIGNYLKYIKCFPDFHTWCRFS
jgi:hypothetical protein